MGLLSKEQIRELIKSEKLTTVQDVNNLLKDLFSETLQEILEGELDTELGYPKHGEKPEGTTNRRNGHSSKRVRSDKGEIELAIPRDRDGEFEPVIIPKHQKEAVGIDEQILALYAKGGYRSEKSRITCIRCTGWKSPRP